MLDKLLIDLHKIKMNLKHQIQHSNLYIILFDGFIGLIVHHAEALVIPITGGFDSVAFMISWR